jgi:hypothetical protein
MGEPAFRGAGKVEGLELWRIENLAPVKITPVISYPPTFFYIYSYFAVY